MAQLLELQLWSAAPPGPSQNRKSLPPHLVTKRRKSASIEEEGPANQPDLFIGIDPGLASATEGGYLARLFPLLFQFPEFIAILLANASFKFIIASLPRIRHKSNGGFYVHGTLSRPFSRELGLKWRSHRHSLRWGRRRTARFQLRRE